MYHDIPTIPCKYLCLTQTHSWLPDHGVQSLCQRDITFLGLPDDCSSKDAVLYWPQPVPQGCIEEVC